MAQNVGSLVKVVFLVVVGVLAMGLSSGVEAHLVDAAPHGAAQGAVAGVAGRHIDLPPRPDKPNVLVVVVDDLRPMFGAYGDTVVNAPHLDALAAQSVRFRNAYVQQAVCGWVAVRVPYPAARPPRPRPTLSMLTPLA